MKKFHALAALAILSGVLASPSPELNARASSNIIPITVKGNGKQYQTATFSQFRAENYVQLSFKETNAFISVVSTISPGEHLNLQIL